MPESLATPGGALPNVAMHHHHARRDGVRNRFEVPHDSTPSRGCAKGLRIRSFVEGEAVVAEWRAEPHHEAFPGVLNGGIVGALLDCHSNWTAAHHLMRAAGADHVPSCVTAEYAVKMRKPTPTAGGLRLEAKVIGSNTDRATSKRRSPRPAWSPRPAVARSSR